MLRTLAIALVVPPEQLSLSAGLVQAFNDFLVPFGLGGLVPIFALMAGLGACATLTTWMLGPARGLSVAARRRFRRPEWRAPVGTGVTSEALA